jgi:hypothetical protein
MCSSRKLIFSISCDRQLSTSSTRRAAFSSSSSAWATGKQVTDRGCLLWGSLSHCVRLPVADAYSASSRTAVLRNLDRCEEGSLGGKRSSKQRSAFPFGCAPLSPCQVPLIPKTWHPVARHRCQVEQLDWRAVSTEARRQISAGTNLQIEGCSEKYVCGPCNHSYLLVLVFVGGPACGLGCQIQVGHVLRERVR